MEKNVQQAISLVDELSQQLIELANNSRISGDHQSGYERLRRWKERAARKIGDEISSIEGNKLSNKRKGSFKMGDPIGNLVDETQMYLGFLKALREDLENHPEDILDRATPSTPAAVPEVDNRETTRLDNCVFIVHGHDELNLLRTKDLLRDRWELEPVVLSSKAGKGRTIIEKFEEEAQRASFAFVLLTPDDVIQKDEMEYSQARPNVIFELGWFYGRLGRGRVCILFKQGTKIHSDLDGISRIQFKDSVIESIDEIEKELIAAGLLKK